MENNKAGLYVVIAYFLLTFGIPICSILFETEYGENTYDNYARIVAMDYKGIVQDDDYENGGSLLVTERLTFDVHAKDHYNEFYELWRVLEEAEIDGLRSDFEVLSVKEIKEDGTEIVYDESDKLYWDDSDFTDTYGGYGPGKWYHSPGPYNEALRRYESLMFYVDGLYRERVTFEIQYIKRNASFRYKDVSQLYLTFIWDDEKIYLENFNAQILVPDKDMAKEGNYKAFTYGTNGDDFPMTESKTLNPGYHTFLMELDKDDLKFKPYNQYLEFDLFTFNEDAHVFTDYAKKNLYYNAPFYDEAMKGAEDYYNTGKKFAMIKGIILLASIGISILIVRSAIKYDEKLKTKYVLFNEPENILYFRDIPSDLDPYFAAELALCKSKKKVDEGDAYSAILLSLVRKGYVSLTRINPNSGWTQNNININLLYRPPRTTPNPFMNGKPKVQNDSYKVQTSPVNIYGNNNGGFTQNTNSMQQVNMHTMQNYMPTAFPTMAGTTANANVSQPYVANKVTQNNINNPGLDTVQEQILNKQLTNIDGKILEPLSVNEEAYFNIILRHATYDSLNMSLFQSRVSYDYDVTDTFVTKVKNSISNIGINKGYFQKGDFKQLMNFVKGKGKGSIIWGIIFLLPYLYTRTTRLDYMFGALFVLCAAMIYRGIILIKKSKDYVLLTKYGAEEYAKWHGLYSFLNNETLLNEKNVPDVVLWEKYLVYATAFGISDKVIKALEINCPNISQSVVLSNTYYRSSSFRSSGRSIHSSARSASNTSRMSRSGGYSSGGRGSGSGGGGS